jgi:hypothetical protein
VNSALLGILLGLGSQPTAHLGSPKSGAVTNNEIMSQGGYDGVMADVYIIYISLSLSASMYICITWNEPRRANQRAPGIWMKFESKM